MRSIYIAGLALVALATGLFGATAQATDGGESLSQSADVSVCGEVELSGTNETGFAFGIVWTTEDGQDGVFGVPGSETVTFEEDVNGGTVWVSYGISVGAESDWYLPHSTATVITDCLPPEPTATPEPETGTITITKDTNPNSFDVAFDYDGSFDFTLEDDNSGNNQDVWTAELEPGSYEFIEDVAEGYELWDVDCSGGNVDIDLNGPVHLTVDLDAGDDVTCRFRNDAVPVEPTIAPTLAPIPTPALIFVPGPERVVEVEVPARISPPSTGDAGLK